MADLQGLAHFTGLADIISADMTLSHGITPSACTITTVPRNVFVAEVGRLQFTFGSTRIVFEDAAIDYGSLSISNGYRWTLRILDRRWKWQFGEITGRYNLRDAQGDVIKDTDRTPRQLAKLLLEAMKEQGFDVSALPEDPRPEVEWIASNPAQELAALCESLGCRIVLGLNNKVKIWPLGTGRALPTGGTAMNQGFGLQAKLRPDSLKVVAGPTVIQSKLELEAVGLDIDGQIKLIDKLSYKPADGWRGEYFGGFAGVTKTYHDFEGGVTRYARDLALRTVYRWYRIKGQAEGGIAPKGVQGGKFTKIDQLLPIEPTLNESADDPDGIARPRPAYLEGVWWSWLLFSNTPADTFYVGGFSVRGDVGIVELSEAVLKLQAADNKIVPAELFLTCSYQIRKEENAAQDRFTVERKLPGKTNHKAGPRLLHHPEIILRQIVRYNGKKVTKVDSNENEVREEANHYIDAGLTEYQNVESSDVQYAGLMALEPDGAIQQVSWKVGGNSPAVTRASRNSEHAISATPYQEKRRRERAAKRDAEEAKWGL